MGKRHPREKALGAGPASSVLPLAVSPCLDLCVRLRLFCQRLFSPLFQEPHPLERASFSFPRSYPFSSFSFSPFFFIPPISHPTPFHIHPLSTLPLVVCSAVEKTFLKVPLVFFIFYVLKMFVVLSPSFLLSNISNLSLPQYLFPSSPATQKRMFKSTFSQMHSRKQL